MKTTVLALTTAIALGATPVLAAVTDGDILGTNETDIRTALEGSGYIVEEIEFEADEIEIDAMLDGVAVEIELSADTGAVLEVEVETDDHDDDK